MKCGNTNIVFDREQGKLQTGRSKNSRLIIASENLHLFIFGPLQGNNAFGITLRLRKNDQWDHYRLVLGQHNSLRAGRMRYRRGISKLMLRPTLTLLELSHWKTRRDLSTRIGTKGYLRLKAAVGGREQ